MTFVGSECILLDWHGLLPAAVFFLFACMAKWQHPAPIQLNKEWLSLWLSKALHMLFNDHDGCIVILDSRIQKREQQDKSSASNFQLVCLLESKSRFSPEELGASTQLLPFEKIRFLRWATNP